MVSVKVFHPSATSVSPKSTVSVVDYSVEDGRPQWKWVEVGASSDPDGLVTPGCVSWWVTVRPGVESSTGISLSRCLGLTLSLPPP